MVAPAAGEGASTSASDMVTPPPRPPLVRQSTKPSLVRQTTRSLLTPGSTPRAYKTAPKWTDVRTFVKVGGRTRKSMHEARANQEASALPDILAGVTTEVTSQEELESLPFHMQGSVEMYKPEALMARMELRQHPGVVAELQRWWDVAMNSDARNQQQREAELVEPTISYEGYVQLTLCIFKAACSTFEKGDAEASARSDWVVDAHGGGQMTRVMFMDAFFQCVARSPLLPAPRLST